MRHWHVALVSSVELGRLECRITAVLSLMRDLRKAGDPLYTSVVTPGAHFLNQGIQLVKVGKGTIKRDQVLASPR